MTSELWLGIFIGGGIAMAIFFLIALMWAITARSSQISREEEKRGCRYEPIPPPDKDMEEMRDLVYGIPQRGYDPLGQADPRPEPIPPDHDVKSS